MLPHALILASLAALAAFATPAAERARARQPAESAADVARRIDQRDTGRDSRLEMTMRLFDRQGRVRQRSLVVTTLRERGDRGDRVLVRFTSPNDIKGTGLLVWEHPAAEDERFLYLPALGRVRRIAGAEKQESFVGSDLSYEDIGGRALDDYTYAFVQRDAEWTGPDGARHPAWQLASTAVDPRAAYPRTVSLVRKDNLVVVSADVFNRRGERQKRYEVRRLERVDGVWTVMDAVMANDLERTRTELAIDRARYNVGLTAADFTRRTLEQDAR